MASGVKGSSFRLVTAYGAIIVGRIEAGSIYYHFESREEILRAVLERGIGDARRDVMMAIEMAGPELAPGPVAGRTWRSSQVHTAPPLLVAAAAGL